MKYFESHKNILEELMHNQKPLGLSNPDLFLLAKNEGYTFERFSHLNILRDPVWIEEDKPVSKWKFTETYRVKY